MYWSSTSDYVSDNNDSPKDVEKKTTYRQRIFPTSCKRELKDLLKIYVPCVLTNLFRFLNPTISMIMCGRLSKLEFNASSLANSIIYIFGSTIDMGFSTAFDTLFAQIYGSDQKRKMGVLLQKAIIIMTLVYIILACFHLNIGPILILLKQDPLVSELATRYVTIYLPGLFFDFQFLTFSRFLQNQNILYPTVVSALISNIVNGISQYVAIYVYGYGLDFSAMIQAMSCFVMFVLQLGYILISKNCKDTWDGFSMRGALENWKLIFSLGIPGILMLLLEEGTFEFTTIIAGMIDSVQLGAQSIALECATLSLISTFGLEMAITMRIGQYLGSREIERLKTCFRMSVVIAMCISTVSFFVILFFRRNITTLFTNDLEIQNEGSSLLIYIAVLQFIDILAGITGGAIKACGRQRLGTCVMFVCYYIIGLPLGSVLAFVFHMKIKGIWIGLMVGLFIETMLFIIVIHRTDWTVECDKALANAECLEDSESSFFSEDEITEETPLITKSDVEHEDRSVGDNYNYSLPTFSRKNGRTFHSLSEYGEIALQRRRSMMCFVPEIIKTKTRDTFRKTVIKRTITISGILVVFFGFLLVRIYMPKSWFMPCIPITNETITMFKGNSEIFCNYGSGNVTVLV